MTEKTQFDEETIRTLQDMRRANAAIGACAEILSEHISNAGSLPGSPSVFIRLDPNQEVGLIFAIEACSNRIRREFDDYLEELGVYWQDEFSPDLNRQAQAVDELQNGKITFDEFESRVNH